MSIGGCPPSQKITGYGAIWQYCDPITGEFFTFAGTKDVSFPTLSREAIETTSGDGPGWEEYIPDTVKLIEEVDVEADFLLSQYDKVFMFFEDATITRWRLVLTQIDTEPYLEFCAFIMSTAADFPLKDLATHTVTLKPTGAPERGELVP